MFQPVGAGGATLSANQSNSIRRTQVKINAEAFFDKDIGTDPIHI